MTMAGAPKAWRLRPCALSAQLCALEAGEYRPQGRLAFGGPLGPVGEKARELAKRLRGLRPARYLLDHLTAIRRRAEELGIEVDDDAGGEAHARAEILERHFGTLGETDLVEHEDRRPVVGARGLDLVDQVLSVAQVCGIGNSGDDHVVSAHHQLFRPLGPDMRHVEHDPWRAVAHYLEHGLASAGVEIVRPVERAGRGEQAEIIRAARQEPVELEHIETVRRSERIDDALRGVLVEIEPGRAEGEIEIGDHHFPLERSGDGEGGVVANGARARAALRADKGDGLADRPCFRIAVYARQGLDDLEHAYGSDQILADAATKELAIDHDVVEMADDHDFGGG